MRSLAHFDKGADAKLAMGSTVAHLINHNYAKGFQTQTAVVVTFPVAKA